MAVVKKLQSGGTAISNPFEEYVYQDLTSGALSKNSLDKVKPVAKQWSELYKYVETSGKPLEEFIKFDRIGETYEINTESLPEELKKYNWTGYKKKPSKNFLGKYSINDEMSANDYYGSLFLKYIVDKGTPVKTNKVKETRDIPVLQNYILTSQFGNEKNNESLFEETWSKLSSDQKKERVINSAKENIKLYLEDYSKNSNVHDYKNIETVRKINEYLDKGDIEGFIKESNKLGWDPNSLMLSEESTTSTPETTQVEPNPEEIKQKAVNNFVESGLSPELAEKLTEAGYNIDWNYNPANQEWFPQYLKEQKAVPVKSPTGSYSILKGSGVFDSRMINPTQGDRYGHYWSHDADWNINYSAPGTDQWSSEGYHDPLFGKRGMREINVTLPINFSGWKTYGISDPKYKDSLGFTDYTKHLLIEDPNKTQSLELWWDSSKNTYIDQFGKPFSSLKINQYSGSPKEWSTFENVQDEFSNIPAKNYGLVTVSEIRKKLKEILPSNESGIRDIDKKNKEQVAQIIAQLKYILNTSNNRLEWENAYELYSELTGVIKPDTFKKLKNLNTNLVNPNKFLKGGVIKAQVGTKLTPDEYIKKYTKTSTDSKSNSSDLNIRDTTGTLRDMDFADWGSLGSSVVSFVPGVGAIGGVAATGFDLYRDIRDDKNVLPNLATNLAFTGLSLIGLGGLKSLKLAGQGVKTLNTSKATKNLVKLSKTGIDVKELKGSLQLVKEAEKVAKASKIPLKEATIQVLKLSDDVSDIATLTNKADVLLGAVSKLEKIPPTTLVGKALVSPIVTKTGKNLATGAMLTTSVGSGIKAGINIAGDIQEGGVGNINPEDLKSVALLGSIGSQTAVNRYGKSKVSKFTKPTEVKSASYKATIKTDSGDVDINISDLPNKEFHIKNLLNFKVKKPTEESLNLLKDDLIKKGIDENSALKFIEQYKTKGDKLFTFIPEKKSGVELITDIEKIMQDPSGYNRAKRILEKNFAPSGSPVYFWQEGVKVPFSFTGTNLLGEAPVIRKRPVKTYVGVKNEVVKDPTITKSPLMASKPVVLSTSSVTPNLDIKWKPLSGIDPLMTKNNDKLMAMKKIKPERMSFKDRKAYNSAIKEDLSLEKTTDASGFAGLTSKTNLNKIGQYVNPAMVANTLGLGVNIIGNKRAADFYKKGVIEGIYRDPSIPHRFTRVSSDIDIPYNKRIADAKLQTKNLSEVTSDSDASRGIALEGLRIQNQIATERDINKHRDILQQRGIAEANTTEVDRINTQIYAGNKARAAAGRQNLMNIEGGRQASNSQAIQNYIKGMTHAVGEAKKERADNKLFDYMQSDDVKNTYNAVQNLSQKEQAIRDKWNAYLESPEGRYAKEGNSTIESFPEYQQFLIEKNATIKNYENVNKILERLKFNTSGRYLYSKDGGKLNSLSLEAIKELNKKILNDNKLLQKMLNRYESKYK